jgi:peroxiredoxin
VSLHDFAGRKVLLVFTQAGCGPCTVIVPELNKLHAKGEVRVLVVNNGDADVTRQWAAEVQARFPTGAQEKHAVARRYEVFATPFAFLIDERGVVASKGIINNGQHIAYILAGARNETTNGDVDNEPSGMERGESTDVLSHSKVKEVSHV